MYLAIIYKACKDKNCDRTFRGNIIHYKMLS